MEEERRGTRLLSWFLLRVGIWGLGAIAGWVIASSLLPRPIPEAHIVGIGPARVSWGFVATLFGCLALGLLLAKDRNWGNKIALAVSIAIWAGVIAPEEGKVISMIVGFVIPIILMIIQAFFGREVSARPAAQPQTAQPGAGIGFQAGIGLGGTEQIDLAQILHDRERAAADGAAAQLLDWCGKTMQSGGHLGTMAGVLAETLLAEQLARRGYRVVQPGEAAEEQPQPQSRISLIRNLLSGGKRTIPKV